MRRGADLGGTSGPGGIEDPGEIADPKDEAGSDAVECWEALIARTDEMIDSCDRVVSDTVAPPADATTQSAASAMRTKKRAERRCRARARQGAALRTGHLLPPRGLRLFACHSAVPEVGAAGAAHRHQHATGGHR